MNKGSSTVIVSLLGLLVLAGSAFYLSNTLKSTDTTVKESQASMAQPTITEYFSDDFKTKTINTAKWSVNTTDGTVAQQTDANNLRFDISGGANANKHKFGILAFKDAIKKDADFSMVTVVFRPVVTGSGLGVSGVRYIPIGASNREGAHIQWTVNGTSSKVAFSVYGKDNTPLMEKTAEMPSTVAVFGFVRVNNAYRAWYKVGNDTTADGKFTVLGEVSAPNVGQEGRLQLFGSNVGNQNLFPKVVSRFDSVVIGWEGAASAQKRFNDAFANGNMGPKWQSFATAGTAISETPQDNLTMIVSKDSANGKRKVGTLIRKDPVVPVGKDFAINAVLFKPKVTGEGTGVSGVGFVSNTQEDDEDARVSWAVTGNVSKLVFAVRAPDGTLLEHANVNVSAEKLTLSLRRNGTSYTAWFRTGDGDTDFVKIGSEKSGSLGGDGKFFLSTTNMGTGNKFPRVIGKFDSVNGWVAN